MEITCHLRRTDTDSLAKGPIEPYFDAFKQYLAQHGYAAHTSSSYVIDIACCRRPKTEPLLEVVPIQN